MIIDMTYVLFMEEFNALLVSGSLQAATPLNLSTGTEKNKQRST
jgi:hypothetical protein